MTLEITGVVRLILASPIGAVQALTGVGPMETSGGSQSARPVAWELQELLEKFPVARSGR